MTMERKLLENPNTEVQNRADVRSFVKRPKIRIPETQMNGRTTFRANTHLSYNDPLIKLSIRLFRTFLENLKIQTFRVFTYI